MCVPLGLCDSLRFNQAIACIHSLLLSCLGVSHGMAKLQFSCHLWKSIRVISNFWLWQLKWLSAGSFKCYPCGIVVSSHSRVWSGGHCPSFLGNILFCYLALIQQVLWSEVLHCLHSTKKQMSENYLCQLLHFNDLQPSAHSCSGEIQNENLVCGPHLSSCGL